MPNTIQLPHELYIALRKKAATQQKTADALVIEWVSEHLNEPAADEITHAFKQEIAAFERMKPTLLTHYAGKYVAIYQGELVASGDEKWALLDQVHEQFGDVMCYVEKVAPDSPRTVRIPSVRVAR